MKTGLCLSLVSLRCSDALKPSFSGKCEQLPKIEVIAECCFVVQPGETVTYTVNVINHGTEASNFDITISNELWKFYGVNPLDPYDNGNEIIGTADGWVDRSDLPASVSLTSGQRISYPLRVTLPLSATQGTWIKTYVEAQQPEHQSVTDGAEMITMRND